MDLSKCYVASTGNILTPKGRMSHAQYTIEAQENDQGKMVYNGALLFPPDSDFTLLKQAMGKVALPNCGGDKQKAIAAVKRRFLDPMNKPGGGKPESEEFEGWTLLRMSSKFLPDFIGPDGKQMPFDQVRSQNLVYSGRWARFSVNPYWFSTKANSGVTLGMQNIQLLDHDENIGGGKAKGDGEFEAVEGIEPDADASGGYNQNPDDADDMFDEDNPF